MYRDHLEKYPGKSAIVDFGHFLGFFCQKPIITILSCYPAYHIAADCLTEISRHLCNTFDKSFDNEILAFSHYCTE